MIDKLLGEYLPATLTFIVGFLGICSQLTINFFSEHGKHKLEINKIKNQNIYEYYLPLLALVREYDYYQKILSTNEVFTLSNWNYPNQTELKQQYELLKETYSNIENLSKGHYVPTEDVLNREIQNFNRHVILVNCLWRSKCEVAFFSHCFPKMSDEVMMQLPS